MSELTNIHARAVKDLTTPTNLPADPDALDQVKLVAGNFPAEYAGNEAMTVGVIKELAAQGREEEIEEVIQYVDNGLSLKAPQATTYTKAEVDRALVTKAPQETTYTKFEVDTKFSAYVGGRKAYKTLALAQAAQSSLPANTAIEVTNDPNASNNGTYQWNGTALTKSAYDPIDLAKSYTDSYLSTVLNKTSSTVVNIDDPSLTIVNKVALVDGGAPKWVDSSRHEAVLVPITPKSVFEITTGNVPGYLKAYVVFYNSQETLLTDGVTLTDREVVYSIPNNTKKLLSAPSFADTMLVGKRVFDVSVKPNSVSEVSNVLLSTGNVVDDYNTNSARLPLSSSRGSDLDKRVKKLSDSITLRQSSVIPINETLSYIKDLFIRKTTNSPSSYAWDTLAGDKFAVIPLNGAISVKIKARPMLQAEITFQEDDATPISGTALSIDSGTVVVPKNTEMEIAVPTGKNYVLVSVISYGYLTRPDMVELIYKKSLSSDDVLNTLPAVGSKAPISANVALELQEQISSGIGKEIPKVIGVGQKTSVFATHKNFILKDELVNDVSHIMVSRDLGVTWTQFPNTIGKITNFHFFVDGTIMLCGTGKVYTLNDDYTGLIESTVIDHDGSVFVPENPDDEHHFYSLIYGNQTQYVDGVEIFFWGEYRFNGAIRMWYTVDRGRTVKCAVKFGTTVMDGIVRNIRHVHMVTQRRQDEKFYFSTGDHGEDGVENMIITGEYDVITDTWDWKVLASGWKYKFGDIFFDDYYAYVLTDYTSPEERPLTGLYRVAVENLGDFSKYHAIFKPEFSDLGYGTFSRYIEDSNGNKIIFPDNAGHGRLWIARGDMNFKHHTAFSTDYVSFMNRLGVNDLGDIYSNDPFADPEPTGTMSQKLYINHGSHNLTKILRDAGLSNFMTQRSLISDTWVK